MASSDSERAEERARRARRDLERVRMDRSIGRAIAQGFAPDDVAALVSVDRTTVDRVARRIRAGVDVDAVGPAEVINSKVVGEIDGAEMMRRLGEMTYSAGVYDPTGGDGYLRGTWDEVQSACGQGLITIEQYDWLVQHADIRPQRP